MRARAPWTAWAVLALLMLASIVSFVDRQVVAIVVEPMKVDLAISDSQVGWLNGVFAVFYAIAAWPIALMADSKSRKHIIAIGIFFWSVMTIACGLSRHFWQVFVARIGVGIGEASLGPATVSMTGDLFPREQIPLALSVFQTAAVMGSGIAFIIGGGLSGLNRVFPFFEAQTDVIEFTKKINLSQCQPARPVKMVDHAGASTNPPGAHQRLMLPSPGFFKVVVAIPLNMAHQRS